MKSLLELIPYLNGYPAWVRAVVLGLPPLYALGLVFLFVFAPTPLVAIETLRRLATGVKDTIALDVTVRNLTAAVANITTAEVELYSGAKPEGGLLGALTASATYTVEKTEQAVLVHSDQDKLPHETMITRPYDGNPYTRMNLPLSQQVKAGEVDRFIILLRGPEIMLPAHDTIEVKLAYNGKEATLPSVMKFK